MHTNNKSLILKNNFFSPLEQDSDSQDQWCQYSSRLLSDLYEVVCQNRLCGETRIAGTFYRLLKLSIRPFLRNTECWLSGLPLDSENEFMIRT